MKRWLKCILIAGCFISLLGCGNGNTQNISLQQGGENVAVTNEDAGNETVQEDHEDSLQTVYPISVTDATGKEFTFDKAPERIVSTSPSETEILFALGLDEEIVGVSDYDDYPQAALDKPKMGGVVKPNEEALLAANADWVITGLSMEEPVVEQLRQLGIPVFKFDPKHVDDIISNVELIGKIVNRQAEAKQVAEQMRTQVQQVKDAVSGIAEEDKRKVYIEFSPGWTVGKGEFMDELVQIAGGINIAHDLEGWSQISEEKVIEENPAVIIYASGFTDDNGDELDEIIKGRSSWSVIEAVQQERLVGIEKNLLSRSGPRITEALLQIAKGIYPERFADE